MGRSGGGRRLSFGRQTQRLAQIGAAGLILARAQEAVEVDRGVLGLLPLGEMRCRRHRARADRPRPANDCATVLSTIHRPANRIAPRGGAIVRPLDNGARRDAPDEQGLAEVAALLRQSPGRSDIEQSAKTEVGVKDEATKRNAHGVETALNNIVRESAPLFQI